MTSVYILAAIALFVIVLGTGQIVGPRSGKYRITGDSIEFVMFGSFRVWRCPFEDITDIRFTSFLGSFFSPALHLMNRPFAQIILIRRRRGIFRLVLMTPDHPREFVRIIQEKIRSLSSPG
jgi:hypothetical protein